MSQTVQSLSEQARKLSPADRVALVDDILGSLDESDSQLDALWVREAEDRLSAWRRGEIKALPLAEVLGKYRAG